MALHPSILVVDDHPLFRTALTQILQQRIPQCTLLEAHDIDSLQAQLEQDDDLDLILLDLHLPGAHGFSGLIFLAAHYPSIPVMVVSANEVPEIIRRALDHGAAGFLPKSADATTIATAIHSVLNGDIWAPDSLQQARHSGSDEEGAIANVIASLTPQQFRVATMLAQGLLNKQIAYELNVTEATIKAHLTEIFRKLGVHSRTQAVLQMSKLDVLPPAEANFSRT